MNQLQETELKNKVKEQSTIEQRLISMREELGEAIEKSKVSLNLAELVIPNHASKES